VNGVALDALYDIVQTNTTQGYYEVDPYDPSRNRVDLKYKEDDLLVYLKEDVALDGYGKNLEKNAVIGF
jgi:hypothetical protein